MKEAQRTPLDGVEPTMGLAAVVAREASEQYLAGKRAAYGFTQTCIPESMNTIDAEQYGAVKGAGQRIWPLLPPFIADYNLTTVKEQGYDLDDLYRIADYGIEGFADQALAGIERAGSKVLGTLGSLFGKQAEKIDTLQELSAHLLERFSHSKFHFVGKPTPTLEHWLIDDEEYGRHRLAGVNPTLLERYDGNTEMLNALLSGLDSGAAAVLSAHAESRLFWVNYAARLAPITLTIKGEYLATEAVALFTVSDDRLMPAAIRLETDGPWFTPEDGFAWLLAKMYASNAETQDQGMRAHLLCTHLVHETIAIGTERAFSERHPLRLLLGPHLRYTITINALARKMMLNKEGNIDKVNSGGRMAALEQINHAYRKLKVVDLLLPTDLAARGVDVDSLPIPYPYRDDGLVMWGAILRFCKTIVEAYYDSDEALSADPQLTWWSRELAEQFNRGAPEAPDLFDGNATFAGSAQRFPERFETRAALAEMLANIIFGATFEHAAVNNTQFAYYGYIPNGPLLLRQPPPKDKNVSVQDIMAALPDVDQALFQLSFMRQLTATSENTVLRPDEDNFEYLLRLYGFVDEDAQAAVRAHASHLEEAAAKLKEGAAKRIAAFRAAHPDAEQIPYSVSYTFMDPTTVDNCIQI